MSNFYGCTQVNSKKEQIDEDYETEFVYTSLDNC